MVFVACLVMKMITGEIRRSKISSRIDKEDWVSALVTSEFMNFLGIKIKLSN